MTAQQWLSALNERVFFRLRQQRLDQLLTPGATAAAHRTLLSSTPASVVCAHDRRIWLSAINSGATLSPSAPERGTRTFQAIEDNPFAERFRRRTLRTAVVELAVSGGARDIADHLGDLYQVPAPVQSSGGTRHRSGTARGSGGELETA
jgi:hypothetical protein